MEKNLIDELKTRLKNGLVSFTYTKKDGSTRTATGTTNVGIVAEHNATPNGNSSYSVPENTTRYYDTVSEGWRSFKNDNLVSIDD